MMNEVLNNNGVGLDKEFLDFECQELQADNERFAVTDDNKADWCLGKIADAEKQKLEIIQYVERKKAMLDAFAKNALAQQDGTINFMTSLLRPYVEAKVEGQKKQSIKLLNGTCGLRNPKPKFEVDEAVLLAWEKENKPEMVKVTEKANWAELKKQVVVEGDKVVTEDGEVVPGVTVVQPEEKEFYVK